MELHQKSLQLVHQTMVFPHMRELGVEKRRHRGIGRRSPFPRLQVEMAMTLLRQQIFSVSEGCLILTMWKTRKLWQYLDSRIHSMWNPPPKLSKDPPLARK